MLFEVNRDSPKGYPVTERQLRHFAIPLQLLITLAVDVATEDLLDLVLRVLLRCEEVKKNPEATQNR